MKDKISISISIPVKAHVKKYLQVRYGNEHQLTKNSLLGYLLFQILDKKQAGAKNDFSEYPEKYQILISQHYMNDAGFEISLKKRKFLALCLDKLFVEDLHLFIDTLIGHSSSSATEAMRLFLKQYAISENDVKFESLYRQYQRKSNENISQKKAFIKLKKLKK